MKQSGIDKIGKSGNLSRLSERKSFTILKVRPDDLSFYQNSISESLGNFSEVRENSEPSLNFTFQNNFFFDRKQRYILSQILSELI